MRKVAIVILSLILVISGGFVWYYFYGPCGTQLVKQAAEEMFDKTEKFNDAFDLAGSTSRISLTGPISDLQEIKQQTEDIEVPACLQPAKSYTVSGMQSAIDGFIAFMGQESDSVVNNHFDTAFYEIGLATEELDTIVVCAPFCTQDPYKRIP